MFKPWGLTALVAGAALLIGAPAHAEPAGDLERCRTQPMAASHLIQIADSDLGPIAKRRSSRLLDSVPMGDLQQIKDFHPETDRWTERNNRIRITVWQGIWAFSSELDIHHDYVIGFRINWEVPGFIGIRWDSGFVPWSRLEVKTATTVNGKSSRWMSGFVHAHTLSLAIFNPELSTEDLAFWAGFGAGIWTYQYQEDDVFGAGTRIDGEFNNEFSFSGNIFIELDYKIADTFHLGIGIRQHFLLADHTDDGQFYDLSVNGQTINNVAPTPGSVGTDGRNEGPLDDLAGVTEFTFNLSVLF